MFFVACPGFHNVKIMVGHSSLNVFKWVLSCILYYFFSVMLVSLQVLHCCVNGSSTYTQQSHYVLSLADLSSSDYDPFLPLGNVKSSEPAQCHSSTDLGNLLTVAEGKSSQSVVRTSMSGVSS